MPHKRVGIQARQMRGVLFGAVAIVFVAAASAVAAQRTLSTEARVANALQGLTRFTTTHSFDDLRSTITALASTGVDLTPTDPSTFIQRRRAVVGGWAQVLRAIETSYDPTFDPYDPKNRPTACVVSPPEPDGRQSPSCNDPDAVHDPNTRAIYVAAIKANDVKIKRMAYYQQLHNLDELAMSSFSVQLENFGTVAPPDANALDAILSRAGVSAARRATIEATERRAESQQRKAGGV